MEGIDAGHHAEHGHTVMGTWVEQRSSIGRSRHARNGKRAHTGPAVDTTICGCDGDYKSSSTVDASAFFADAASARRRISASTFGLNAASFAAYIASSFAS